MDHGFPFDTRGLWHALSLPQERAKEHLFEEVEFDVSALDKVNADAAHLNDSFFELPPLIADGDPLAAFQLHESSPAPQDTFVPPVLSAKQSDKEPALDIWNTEDVQQPAEVRPPFRTWETFEEKPAGSFVQMCYVSEAGPEAFSAALSARPDRPNDGVLPTDTILRAFANLAVGRSSAFFTWHETEQCFRATLPDVPYFGLSSALSTSLTQSIMDYAVLFRRLQTFSENTGRGTGHCAVLTALRGCVTSVLAAVEGDVSQNLAHVRSLLQLQQVIRRPADVLRLTEQLRRAVEGAQTDEAAAICLYNTVTRLVDTQTEYAAILTLILGEASKPWLISLVADMTAGPVIASSQSGSEEASLENSGDSAASDALIPPMANGLLTCDEQLLIKESRETARLLRQCLLATVSPVAVLDEVLSSVHEFGAPADPDLDDGQSRDQDHWPFTAEPERVVDVSGLDSLVVPEQLDFSRGNTVAAATWGVLASEFKGRMPTRSLAVVPSPFDLIRPAVERHSRTLNRHLLSHLFGACQLRLHLQLQHDFHLLGDGNFVMRLSTALFAARTQTAGRKRGQVPTGEVMGLRLDAREEQRWPPASSELRLTLMGVLTEAYDGEKSDIRHHSGRENLPGGLSFAIRELPDAEIDRVLEADSIYALDFLRLQYAAPAPLDAILTPRMMQWYDDIFRHLLRLLRLQHATKQVHHQLLQEELCPPEALRFSFAALHVIGELMAYTMECGIADSWRKLQQSLDAVEHSLTGPGPASAGVTALRENHQQFLEAVRGRLFLRKKHEALLKALENVLTAALTVSKAVRSGFDDNRRAPLPVEYGVFYQAMTHLTDVLQKQADRHGRTKSGMRPGEDVEMLQLLLMKLDWNEAFSRSTR